MPTVSIITPVFNRPDLLRQTAASIVAQSAPDWECLLIDDGSGQETLNLLDELRQSDPRFWVAYAHEGPQGANRCRNLGIGLARGKYLIFLDSDDLLKPHCLESRMRFLDARPDLDFAVFPAHYFTGNPADTVGYLSTARTAEPIAEFLRLDLPWITLCPIWRKSAIMDAGLSWTPTCRGFQDIDFHLQALLAKLRFAYAEVPADADYRLGNNGQNMGSNLDRVDRIRDNFDTFCRWEGWLQATQKSARFDELVKRVNGDVLRNCGIDPSLRSLLPAVRQNLPHRIPSPYFALCECAATAIVAYERHCRLAHRPSRFAKAAQYLLGYHLSRARHFLQPLHRPWWRFRAPF